jgi:hypothetical protein
MGHNPKIDDRMVALGSVVHKESNGDYMSNEICQPPKRIQTKFEIPRQ